MFQLYIFCFSFFALNLLFILFSVHYLAYPITTFIFFTIFIVKYYSNIQKQEAQITHEMNQNFLQNLPKQRLLNEIKMAKRVQQGLLLVESPNIDGINIVKRCIPAENIGGDFFSFICKDHEQMAPHQSTPGIVKYVHSENQHLGIVIGDVAGHGVSSALIMALSAGLFSEIGKQHLSPKKVLEEANKDLIRYIENSQITHVTAFYGVLNVDTLEFHYCRAGHPQILVQRDHDQIIELNTSGSFLGMFENIEFEEAKINLKRGDRLYFYTDGIPEAKGPNGDLFGYDRLKNSIIKYQHEPIGTVIHQLFDEVDLFTQYQKATDDRSVVIIELNQ